MAITITIQPDATKAVIVGGVLSFTIEVNSDSPPLVLTLIKDGVIISGPTADIYNMTFIKKGFLPSDAGTYTFHVKDKEEEFNSTDCVVSVLTSRLTQIAAEIKSMVEGMTIDSGYYNNWGAANKQDAARANAWPRAEIRYKSQTPGTDLSHYYGMMNAEFTIEIEPKITPSGTVDSVLDVDAYMDTALSDLIKLFLASGSYLPLSEEAVITFKDAQRETVRAGDVFRPGKLITKWNVHYHNS